MHLLRSRSIRTALAVCAALGPCFFGPSTADACMNNYPNGHVYAEIEKDNASGANNGAAVDIDTSSLTASDARNFVNHEMWYGVVGNGAYWVEVGFKDGLTCRSASSLSGSCSDTTAVHQRIFWADNRNGGGYHEHYPNVGWSLNHKYQVIVAWAGTSCAWNVYAAGSFLGTSTGNCGGTYRWLAAGIEATSANSGQHVGGSLSNWQRKTGSSWVAGWQGAFAWSGCPAAIAVNGSTTQEALHGL